MRTRCCGSHHAPCLVELLQADPVLLHMSCTGQMLIASRGGVQLLADCVQQYSAAADQEQEPLRCIRLTLRVVHASHRKLSAERAARLLSRKLCTLHLAQGHVLHSSS